MWPMREELRKLRRDDDMVTLLKYAKEATKKKGINGLHVC